MVSARCKTEPSFTVLMPVYRRFAHKPIQCLHWAKRDQVAPTHAQAPNILHGWVAWARCIPRTGTALVIAMLLFGVRTDDVRRARQHFADGKPLSAVRKMRR